MEDLINDIKRKKILLIVFGAVLILFLGTSFAFLTSSDVKEDAIVFNTGDLSMTVNVQGAIKLGDSVTLEDEAPKKDTDASKNEAIIITLANPATNEKAIDIGKYEVKLVVDNSDATKVSNLNEDYIKFAISEDEGQTYTTGKVLSSSNNIVYTGVSLKLGETKKIYLKVWLKEDAPKEIYGTEYYGKIDIELYQLPGEEKYVPTGKEATTIIKNTLGKSTGIIAVTKNNEKIDTQEKLATQLASDNIREYRYSGTGVDNYIYFNCEDGVTAETASSKCKKWRVIGVFKETLEDGSEEEYVKIVDNDLVDGTWFPDTYVVDGTTYKIKSTNTSYPYAAYWNYITGGTSDKNDWSKAGLQYWLNAGEDKQTKNKADGYLSYLSSEAKSMIRKTTYPLGNVEGGSYGDTAKTAYAHERSTSTTCSSSCNGGDVWDGNAKEWPGKIALMYPSDYGFSADSSYWDKALYNFNADSKAPANSSWMYASMTDASSKNSWFLSPSAYNAYNALVWFTTGYADYNNVYSSSHGVRVALNLISQAQIVSGTGTSADPWLVKPE